MRKNKNSEFTDIKVDWKEDFEYDRTRSDKFKLQGPYSIHYFLHSEEIIIYGEYYNDFYHISENEREVLEKEYKIYKENSREMSPNDLAKTFPEAEGDLKKMIKEIDIELNKYKEIERKIVFIVGDVHYSEREIVEMIARGIYLDPFINALNEKKNKLKKILLFMEKRGEIENSYSVDLEKIKQISIKDFIKFDHSGMAKCIWHNDGDPSMKYYKKTNSVYCFSCNKYGSVIDVYMQLFNVDFKEAIQRLNK